MPRIPDIFDRIAALDATPRAPRYVTVKRYLLRYERTAGGEFRSSRRLYERAAALRIVRRLKRRGVDAYASPMMVTEARP